MIDLHSHSTASDGSLNPRQLLRLAHSIGLSALALTDHDTISGLPEADAAAKELGIHFINGIEIESAWEDRGVFHILGLNFVHTHPAIQNIIPTIQALRQARNLSIVNKMSAQGITASLEEIAGPGQSAIITRPHFADYLISIGLVKDRQQAFDEYLAQGKAFYEPYPGLALERIIEIIHQAGGKVVVAHPLSLYVSWGRMEKLFAEWREKGVDGVETWHPSANWRDAQRLDKLAHANGLGLSAGSDFHGEHRPDRILGKTLEERHSIDDRFLALFD